jgi:hypothetical protein
MGTDFLFATPLFVEGFSRVLDLAGSVEDLTYNVSVTPLEADTLALRSDWLVTGRDLEDAAKEYELSSL